MKGKGEKKDEKDWTKIYIKLYWFSKRTFLKGKNGRKEEKKQTTRMMKEESNENINEREVREKVDRRKKVVKSRSKI